MSRWRLKKGPSEDSSEMVLADSDHRSLVLADVDRDSAVHEESTVHEENAVHEERDGSPYHDEDEEDVPHLVIRSSKVLGGTHKQ